MSRMSKILGTFAEPSTWAGLGSIAAAVGVAEPTWATVSTIGALVCGALATLLREKREGA